MNFFGIGGAEMILIMIIAIVVLGPDKIPGAIQMVGKTIRDFRRFTAEMTREFDEATGDIRKEFTTLTSDLKNEIAATQADLQSQLDITSIFNDAINGKTAETVPAVAASAAVDAFTPIPEPVAAFAVPEPTPELSPEPQAITVSTPYAERLAAESNGNGQYETTNGTNGTQDVTAMALAAMDRAQRRATKADPFADFVLLGAPAAPIASPEPQITTYTPEPAYTPYVPEPVAVLSEPEPVAPSAEPVMTAASETMPAAADEPAPRKVGGSVAGSRYARRKTASAV